VIFIQFDYIYIMGRKSHNLTKEQKRKRHNEQRMRSYWKNSDKERTANLVRYYNKKEIGDIRIDK